MNVATEQNNNSVECVHPVVPEGPSGGCDRRGLGGLILSVCRNTESEWVWRDDGQLRGLSGVSVSHSPAARAAPRPVLIDQPDPAL